MPKPRPAVNVDTVKQLGGEFEYLSWHMNFIELGPVHNVITPHLKRDAPWWEDVNHANDRQVAILTESLSDAPRDILFSFVGTAGRNTPNDVLGVREDAWLVFHQFGADLLQDGRVLWENTIISHRRSLEDFFSLLKRSHLCFCPRGFSPTSFRLVEAMQAGCLPVILWEEDLALPYFHLEGGRDASIPWDEFAFIFERSELHLLPEFLRNVQEEDLSRRRRMMLQYVGSHFTAPGVVTQIQRWLVDFRTSPLGPPRRLPLRPEVRFTVPLGRFQSLEEVHAGDLRSSSFVAAWTCLHVRDRQLDSVSWVGSWGPLMDCEVDVRRQLDVERHVKWLERKQRSRHTPTPASASAFMRALRPHTNEIRWTMWQEPNIGDSQQYGAQDVRDSNQMTSRGHPEDLTWKSAFQLLCATEIPKQMVSNRPDRAAFATVSRSLRFKFVLVRFCPASARELERMTDVAQVLEAGLQRLGRDAEIVTCAHWSQCLTRRRWQRNDQVLLLGAHHLARVTIGQDPPLPLVFYFHLLPPATGVFRIVAVRTTTPLALTLCLGSRFLETVLVHYDELPDPAANPEYYGSNVLSVFRRFRVWDIHKSNVELWNMLGVTATYVPIPHRVPPQQPVTKGIDVLVAGCDEPLVRARFKALTNSAAWDPRRTAVCVGSSLDGGTALISRAEIVVKPPARMRFQPCGELQQMWSVASLVVTDETWDDELALRLTQLLDSSSERERAAMESFDKWRNFTASALCAPVAALTWLRTGIVAN